MTSEWNDSCLLYTSDAADDLLCVDLGGRRIIKKKTRRIRIYLISLDSTLESTCGHHILGLAA